MAPDASLSQIFHFFLPAAQLLKATACTEGNINQTWLLRYKTAGMVTQAVLQRLSPVVFPDPPAVMANFRTITRHLAWARHRDHNIPRFPLPLVNPEGKDYWQDATGGLWRLITYIGPSRTLAQVSAAQAASVGAMLARFHLLLRTLAPQELNDPLPGFHDTPAYLARFETIACNRSPKTSDEVFCYKNIHQLRPLAFLLQGKSADHSQQLVHADPKCANFLFVPHGDAVLSLIDLDTVRFGFLLHDLGDCLRSCCNSGGEEKNQQPVFAASHFSALLNAYLQHGGRQLLTAADQNLLLDAARLLIFELGLRFFTDYLQGNPYFGSHYPEHNLHRAMVQFRLHASLLAQENRLRKDLAALLA